MKLSQLPLGARFRYEGRLFTKTGPLTAASDEGGQRMIPRYAVLQAVDGSAPPAESPPPSRQLDEAAVRAAFELFYGSCLRLCDDFSKAELEAARQRFLEALAKN